MLLAIAHPGHELRIYGWLEKHCPSVLVLTDGSGHRREGRFLRTASLLESLQARLCNWFKPYSDRSIYQYILNRDAEFFLDLKAQLINFLLQSVEINFVLSDEYEGYNCVHDLFTLVVHAAICEVQRQTQRAIRHYVYPTIGHPDQCPELLLPDAIIEHLDPDCFDRKIKAALSYTELKDEVNQAIQRNTIQVFQSEFLYPFRTAHPRFEEFMIHKPYYEFYGEQQVEKHHFKDVIRFQEHVYPIQQQLIGSFH